MISDGSIPNGEDDNDTDVEEQENGYINMEIGLPSKDYNGLMHTLVKRRKLDGEGKAVGNMNNNKLLDTREYGVEFADGTTKVLTANIISENILAQVDEKGHCQMLLDSIIDHRRDVKAIEKEEVFTETMKGLKQRKFTTADWKLCIQPSVG